MSNHGFQEKIILLLPGFWSEAGIGLIKKISTPFFLTVQSIFVTKTLKSEILSY
jgi:hypothetical protein